MPRTLITRLGTGARRFALPLLALGGLLATSGCYYGPCGYYGYYGYGYSCYPGYTYAAPAVAGGVVVAPAPRPYYYWR